MDGETQTGLSKRTEAEIRAILAGRSPGLGAPLLFAGPAVIASIAYMDPGNFATNIQAGARYNYQLLWVVVLANLIAMLFQALSAKLGLITGRNLAELCRTHLPRPLVYAMWAVSEVAAMATDLAEFLGGTIGLSLLCHLPLMAGMAVTGFITYFMLLLGGRGFRPMELMIGLLILVIVVCYVAELFIAPVNWAAATTGAVLPRLPDSEALTIAVGIIGATVMPHALYLHSSLTQHRVRPRNDEERMILLRFSDREVVVALSLAGLVNIAMVMTAAGAFHAGHREVADISTAYHTLSPLLGPAAAGVFLVSLMASGISSSTVGTMAGQAVMQGFAGFTIPVWVRRVVTMVPAFVVVAMGVDATRALVISQVVLSFALPVPMVALVVFTRRRDIMGRFANSRLMSGTAIGGAGIILALNAVLLAQTLG
ncbi:MAG: Nramp family divalent metal transporter [Rhodospirillales bacterium]|nr:Nramp family divalent metal transporter [Rhodospirillales bacterium]